MRSKLICLLVVLLTVFVSSAQDVKDTSVKYTKEYVDSLLSNDTLMREFNAFVDSLTAPKSYFDFSVAVGNRLFSVKNNVFNSQQVSANKLTVTPTLAYFNKSGLGLSFASYVVFDSGSTVVAQHALTPSFDYTRSDDVAFGFSFSHYFINKSNSFSSTPFQNEFYGYVNAKKGALQPGLALGWAKGNYRETFETTRTFDTVINGVLRTITRVRRDTINTRLRDISVTAYVQHEFEWYDVLGKNNGITLTPVLMLAGGETKYNVSQSTSRSGLLRPRLFRTVRSTSDNGSTGFRLQSLGLNLSATYTTGKFYISPQYYLDYYLPNDLTAGEKRTTGVFNVTAGITF